MTVKGNYAVLWPGDIPIDKRTEDALDMAPDHVIHIYVYLDWSWDEHRRILLFRRGDEEWDLIRFLFKEKAHRADFFLKARFHDHQDH